MLDCDRLDCDKLDSDDGEALDALLVLVDDEEWLDELSSSTSVTASIKRPISAFRSIASCSVNGMGQLTINRSPLTGGVGNDGETVRSPAMVEAVISAAFPRKAAVVVSLANKTIRFRS